MAKCHSNIPKCDARHYFVMGYDIIRGQAYNGEKDKTLTL